MKTNGCLSDALRLFKDDRSAGCAYFAGLHGTFVPGSYLGDSVHLDVQLDESVIDPLLEARMDLAQRYTSMILALRRKVNIKVRQPLSRVLVPVLDKSLEENLEQVKSIVLNETNVKEMILFTIRPG